ncbi:unnamed protein product, partial [Tetraodon nigroviridis]
RFVVSNGQTSRNGSVEISVEAVDRILPSLSANRGLRVPQGTTVLLGPDRLALSDPDTPAEALTFALSQPPQYGKLLLAGSALTSGSSFTQKNIQEVEVAYQHDGGPSQIDRFGFTASDSTARGFLLDGRLQTEPVFFTVQIQPLDQRAPDVLKLLPLWKAEPLGDGRHGIFLSSRELKAQDAGGGTDEQLMFRVTRQPYFGYLENITTGGFVPRRFSQLELNKRTIVYVIDPDKPSLSDSLEFQVSDALGNTGPSHRLEFRWSSVELSLPSYFVCEEQGAVSLDIIRKGNLAESSYVTVKAEEVTATAGRDYLLSPSSLVQFDPGVSRRSWQIQILQDELEEAAEMFEVLLTSPEGAVIGGIGRAQVTIGRSGSRTGGGDASGGCRLNQSHHAHHAPVLGGREIPLDVYPQHGSIKLEKLPLGTDSLLYTRGDSIPRPSEGATGNQVRVTSNNPQVVRPSSVFHNGTAVVLTYHGMVQMQVEDDTSPSRKGRKANVRVRPAPVVGPELGVGLASELRRRTFKPGSTKGRARMEEPQEVAESSTPKPCSPDLRGLLHLNQSTNQIVHCNGVSWKRWTPTDQMASALTCPRGWTFHGGRCYILNTEKKVTWSQANRTCRERYQGTLSSVLSKADMDWLWDFGRRRPFWIAAGASAMDDQSGQSGPRRLSFAHRGLTEIPYESILAQTATLQVLDLSYNQLQEYPLASPGPDPAPPPPAGSLTRPPPEPGSVGPAAEAQHAGPGREPVHIPHQAALPAQRQHALHQQEQAQQPAPLCGGGPPEGAQPELEMNRHARGEEGRGRGPNLAGSSLEPPGAEPADLYSESPGPERVPRRVAERYILSGYRSPDYSLAECLRSAFRPTNETGNFWSHFLPLFFFSYRVLEVLGWEGAPPGRAPFFYPLWTYFLGVACLLLGSSLAHLLNAMSLVVREVCFFLDYGAIAAYTVGSSLAYFYYIHPRAGLLDRDPEPEPDWAWAWAAPRWAAFFQRFYIPAACAVAVVCVLCCSLTRQRWRRHRYLIRTLVFLLPLLVSSTPVFYRLLAGSPYVAGSASWAASAPSPAFFWRHCLWLLVSAVFNVAKLPERLAPGRFDVWGHSHHWFHCCTFLSILNQLHMIQAEVRAILLSP